MFTGLKGNQQRPYIVHLTNKQETAAVTARLRSFASTTQRPRSSTSITFIPFYTTLTVKSC